MLRIAVCDDEKLFQERIKQYVSKYLSQKDISFQIDMFPSGKELLGLGIEVLGYDILFLDINMEELDGIAIAQKIREYGSNNYLVFVTAYIDYSLEGYKVDAIRYLLKNNVNFEESLFECMDTILYKMNYVVMKKTFQFKECEKDVLVERILYIESKLHQLKFYIMEDEMKVYTLYGTLNEMEKEMEAFPFVRIHQSFLVNLKHIKNVAGYKVILSNQQELMIPKVRYKTVKNAFVAYKGEV